MNRVLITGASGFIGRHTLSLLAARGFEVHAVTSREVAPQKRSEYWHKADLLDGRQVETLIADVAPSHLLHLAWVATPGLYQSSPENLRWVQGSIELARHFVARGGKRIVAAGSCAEYDWRFGFCSEGLTPTAPVSLYGACKLSLQMMLHAFAQSREVSVGWGRIFFPYGPNEHPDRLIASVIRALLRGKPAECTAGRQVRDYIYVKDVADALVTLLDSEVTGPLNIASGHGVAVKDVVLKIGEILERPGLVRLGALEPSTLQAPLLVGDIRQLAEKLHWSPKYSLEQGLQKSVEWWRAELSQENKGR